METTTTTTNFYSIPACNMAAFIERVEKLNKRCRRLKIPVIELATEIDYTAHQIARDDSRAWVAEVDLPLTDKQVANRWKLTGRVMPWYLVKVVGSAPCYDGWKFVATLEPLGSGADAVNLVMAVPGETCPTSFMKDVGRCDHCKQKRNRKQTFVVRHEDGRCVAVGRTCLKDFLGHQDPQRLAAWAEMLAQLGGFAGGAEDDDWMGGGHRTEDPCYDLEFYLGWVAGAIRSNGWMSRGRAREGAGCATVDRVNYIFSPGPFTGKHAAEARAEWEKMKAECTPTEADLAEASEALDWALELDLDALMAEGKEDNYLANVAALARAATVGPRTCGLGGSIVAAAARAKDKAKEVAAKPESKHMGTVKVRETYRVLVERIIPMEGMYGTTYITKMLAWDEERGLFANDMVWFASSENDLEAGSEFTIKATVKDHGDFKGRPQTVVNRCKIAA